MNVILNIVLTVAVIGYCIYLAVKLIRKPASICGCGGSGGCSGGCAGCAMAGKCHAACSSEQPLNKEKE